MYKYLQQRLSLSPEGAKSFLKGVLWTTLLNIALMLPALYVFVFLTEQIQQKILLPQSTHPIFLYIGIAVLFFGITWLIAKGQYRSTFTSVYEESANRRLSLGEKLRRLPLSFFGEKNLSDLTGTIMSDCTELEHTFSHAVPQLFASLITIAMASIGLFIYNWPMALALLWVAPVAGGLVLLSKRIQIKNNEKIYLAKRAVSDHVQEGMENVQDIKAYNREDSYSRETDRKLKEYEKAIGKGELITGLFLDSSKGVLKLGILTLVLVGVYLSTQSSTQVFPFLVFLVFASRIYEPIQEVLNNLAALFHLDIPISRVQQMEALPVQEGSKDFAPSSYDIQFEKVEFAYEEGKTVLNNVSFSLNQGEVTALVGPSGSGKSTAAKLAARFWDVNKGQITIGGIDIKNVDPETLYESLSIVFQDVVLFNSSLLDNIRIGRKDASDEEVLRIAQLAQCDEFALSMPEGYNTVIGENGRTLSGGERQRISIARALLKDAPIVILDEATASLDVENESKIQKALSYLISNKTVLVIAHRMRTIAQADKIIVFDQGHVKEWGTPQELEQKQGLYYKMIQRQLSVTT
ncbi:ABC transporter ATP-binding protein [Spirochaeta cellobiosiphila]|uniref:ABC transporter ATP-binding protein n=1 Tax=Spirochaeta cellobiosiphila TaxID=504483 RepID=UPI0004281FD8|nr:ABC transporter ATP-binding protein [Spirochaeta cellobiosiphila]